MILCKKRRMVLIAHILLVGMFLSLIYIVNMPEFVKIQITFGVGMMVVNNHSWLCRLLKVEDYS